MSSACSQPTPLKGTVGARTSEASCGLGRSGAGPARLGHAFSQALVITRPRKREGVISNRVRSSFPRRGPHSEALEFCSATYPKTTRRKFGSFGVGIRLCVRGFVLCNPCISAAGISPDVEGLLGYYAIGRHFGVVMRENPIGHGHVPSSSRAPTNNAHGGSRPQARLQG